ncbi:MAG: polyphosphate kinase 1 [Pedobacter sp.]|nr:MAG: polyphosphate kinase 1 [Pedobacter sp.]
MTERVYQNRDVSWIGFNERVLVEAAKSSVPLLERIKFLSIFSSNLDEFYRVRMPILRAFDTYGHIQKEIGKQQNEFGRIIYDDVLPGLLEKDIHWIYNKPIPEELMTKVVDVFFSEILTYINTISIDKEDLSGFFAENNRLYQAVVLSDKNGQERVELLNVPSDEVPRLSMLEQNGVKYVVFLEDIIKLNIKYFYPDDQVHGVFNLKITRDAELNVASDFTGDITDELERQLEKRDLGFATRFLAQPGMPLRILYKIIYQLNLKQASVIEGGMYHNLKDLSGFPIHDAAMSYPNWKPVKAVDLPVGVTLFDKINQGDLMVSVPYQSYDDVLRFFNEAAGDKSVEEIYTTLYRVANNSKIVSALITAAKNGKKVVVLVELKARFDEANNIKWAKKMKAAGVKIVYSSLELKVHAKVALVKRKHEMRYLGLLATGNLNETTARFYTDQILMTGHQGMLSELMSLFEFLEKGKKAPAIEDQIDFKHLLVAQFNLHSRFIDLIDREISNAKLGLKSGITIKLNNLEERILIDKLYEASGAGVHVKLIVRGICCLIPGIAGISDHISVKRVVDRYLEHARIFIFENDENPEVFMGSADWMNRNIYSRIEVCFPVYSATLKDMVQRLIDFQLGDNEQQTIYENISSL